MLINYRFTIKVGRTAPLYGLRKGLQPFKASDDGISIMRKNLKRFATRLIPIKTLIAKDYSTCSHVTMNTTE